MSALLREILGFSLIPCLAMVAGGGAAAWRAPGRRFASIVQHFAAGLVFAAVAVEMLPSLTAGDNLPLILGFSSGVAAMLFVGGLTQASEEDGQRSVWGLLIATAVDVFIDGLLVGIGFAAGAKQGMLVTFALTLELLFLGLSAATALIRAGFSRRKSSAMVLALALLVVVGAGLGGTILQGIGASGTQALVAFGVAALLYLVTEELLVEAHEIPDTRFTVAMFFVGFLLVLLLGKTIDAQG